MDHFNDDENVKMMRETARQVGLTELIVSALENDDNTTKELLRKALQILGEDADAKRRRK